jgi:hypothetical protein
MSYNMEFVANTVPAILVLGGILLVILGHFPLGVVCIIAGICMFALNEKIIKL